MRIVYIVSSIIMIILFFSHYSFDTKDNLKFLEGKINIELSKIEYPNELPDDKIRENVSCRIHNHEMFRDKVEIIYGLFRPDDNIVEYLKLRDKHFPYCDDPLRPGCIIMDKNHVEKYICTMCNEERDRYKDLLGFDIASYDSSAFWVK